MDVMEQSRQTRQKRQSPAAAQPSRVGGAPLLNFFSLKKEKLSGLSGLDSDNACAAGLLEESRVWSVAWSVQTVAWSVMTRISPGACGSRRMWVGWVCGEPMPSLHRFGTGLNTPLGQCSTQRHRSADWSSGARFS